MKLPGVRPGARLAILAGCALGALVLVAAALAQNDAPAGADQAWINKYFPLALGEFFPIEHAEGDFLAVRAHREHLNDVPEFSIVLENTQDPNSLSATIHESRQTSLYDQLLALHAKDPSKSYEDLKSELKVGTWKFSAAQCPAIEAQYKAFENIQFVRPHDDDEPSDYPILYEFHESVGGGDSEVIEFMESRAFPVWANATRKALDSCIASSPSTGNRP
jgi:hypothetical protein